ncbi:MAG: homocysteine S-methyltransferase family protein, partial [Bdellovibrionota bacterium]
MSPNLELPPRSRNLVETSQSRVLVLDGAMGTALQSENLTAEDFGGEALEGCNENLNLTRPELIQKIHENYLKAGCDIIETNTFGGTPLVLAEYGLGERAHEINRRAAEIARAAATRHSTPEKPRWVAGSIGPTTKSLSVTGGVTFDELVEHFHCQVQGLADGGVDYFLIETCQDTRNIKAALLALDQLFAERRQSWPVAVSATVEANGTLLAGQNVEALAISLENRKLLYLGLNCATGPEFMTDSIRTLARMSPFPVACVPNAGLPDSNGHYLESPEMLARVVSRFLEEGWLGFVGGCCGTHAGHIEALARIAARAKPAPQLSRPKSSRLAGIDPLEITDEMRPVLVGERCNVIGSRKFKTLITEGRWDEAAELARTQVKAGAQIIDVCLANPDRDEKADVIKFLSTAASRVRAPLMF